MQEEYYLKNLYPLQDRVFSIVEKLTTKFYLTGGTALSRFYTHHRFSDDLDFFVNDDSDFKQMAETIKKALQNEFSDRFETGVIADTFNRFMIHEEQCTLKIDLVNDIPYYFGQLATFDIFSRIDNPLNILSNKICALSRNSAKDVADILFLAQTYSFDWKDIIEAGKQKDMWVNPIDVSSMLDTFPVKLFEDIVWTKSPDFTDCGQKIKIIAHDILLGANNSLLS